MEWTLLIQRARTHMRPVGENEVSSESDIDIALKINTLRLEKDTARIVEKLFCIRLTGPTDANTSILLALCGKSKPGVDSTLSRHRLPR